MKNWREALAGMQLLKYVTIGGFVFIVDAGSFQGLVLLHAVLPLAATVAYALGVGTHFTVNRLLNFRNFDRDWRSQARSYGAIVFAQWLLTIAIIEVLVHVAHTTPLFAKVVAVAVNIPIGFLCHRYMTFGPGIRSRFRQIVTRTPSERPTTGS